MGLCRSPILSQAPILELDRSSDDEEGQKKVMEEVLCWGSFFEVVHQWDLHGFQIVGECQRQSVVNVLERSVYPVEAGV